MTLKVGVTGEFGLHPANDTVIWSLELLRAAGIAPSFCKHMFLQREQEWRDAQAGQ